MVTLLDWTPIVEWYNTARFVVKMDTKKSHFMMTLDYVELEVPTIGPHASHQLVDGHKLQTSNFSGISDHSSGLK